MITQKKSVLDPVQAEITRINDLKNPLVTKLNTLKNKISTAESDNQVIQQEFDSLKLDITNLREKIIKLKTNQLLCKINLFNPI